MEETPVRRTAGTRVIRGAGTLQKRLALAAAPLLVAATGCLLPADGSAARSSQETLALSTTFRGTFGAVASCPSGQGASAIAECYLIEGDAEHGAPPPLVTATGAPGLGRTSLKVTLIFDFPNGSNDPCRVLTLPDARLTVAGRGEIDLAAKNPSCQGGATGRDVFNGSLPFTVTGGSGIYAGATGGGTIELSLLFNNGTSKSDWTGTLTVPGLDFDTTPPTLSGARNTVVTVKKGARAARVRYTVIASDPTDGTVPVTCLPRSGSSFRVGKTRVRCSAVDTSSNAAGASFTVTVRRR
jgi:hypothetical protein